MCIRKKNFGYIRVCKCVTANFCNAVGNGIAFLVFPTGVGNKLGFSFVEENSVLGIEVFASVFNRNTLKSWDSVKYSVVKIFYRSRNVKFA